MRNAYGTARTIARIMLFVSLFMAPVAVFASAHASDGAKAKGAGIVLLTGLQRA